MDLDLREDGIYVTKLASKEDIAHYLKNLEDVAWKESNHDPDNIEVWGELYNKVFSDKIAQNIYKSFPDFSWLDLDTSYQEDVCHFIDGFIDYSGIDIIGD